MSRPVGVVWDVGNVIVRWDPRTLYSKIFPDPAERDAFLAEVCTPAWHLAHDLGVSFEENRRPLLERFPDHAEAILAWETRWWEMFSGPIPETEAAIEALAARGAPQGALTNMSHETREGTFAMSPAFDRLQARVVSGEDKVAKPREDAFQLICQRLGRSPGELLFVDDHHVNIDAAHALGFHTHLFADPAELDPALRTHGLL
jgi:HAD superfamily hydrolase (TIGR01509 family)